MSFLFQVTLSEISEINKTNNSSAEKEVGPIVPASIDIRGFKRKKKNKIIWLLVLQLLGYFSIALLTIIVPKINLCL